MAPAAARMITSTSAAWATVPLRMTCRRCLAGFWMLAVGTVGPARGGELGVQLHQDGEGFLIVVFVVKVSLEMPAWAPPRIMTWRKSEPVTNSTRATFWSVLSMLLMRCFLPSRGSGCR